MPNYNHIICFDFETGGRDPRYCEPIQVAAVVINPYSLDFCRNKNGEPVYFESLMRPLEPEKLEDGALQVNKKTREELAVAPLPGVVWKQFAQFCGQYSVGGKKDSWSAPIAAGHNIAGFDMILVERLCQTYKILNKDGKQGIFNTTYFHDTLQLASYWFNGQKEPARYNLDTLRDFFGLSKDNAHDALGDVMDTGAILTRFLNLARRLQAPDSKAKVRFKDAFKS